ncbi:unnamed protein product, partial [Allacma fusca]
KYSVLLVNLIKLLSIYLKGIFCGRSKYPFQAS